METTLRELRADLRALRRANERWRRLSMLAFLALAVVLLTAAVMPRPAVLEAEQLLIRDASGRVRVAVKPLDGATILTFRDHLERDRLALGVLDDGTPVLSVYDGERRRRLALGVLAADSPGLRLYGKDGVPRLTLVIARDDRPALQLTASDGSTRARLALEENDVPRLSVLDAAGTAVFRLPPTP